MVAIAAVNGAASGQNGDGLDSDGPGLGASESRPSKFRRANRLIARAHSHASYVRVYV
jgi:hypothetical protein